MQRHGNNIKAKRGVKFDSKCSDWCTYQNFETMYTEVYSEMVASGIAMKLDTPMWLNKAGDIVNYEELAFSKKTQFMLLHPRKLLFVDEVGSNMSQAKDGHCGGEKFLVPTEL